MRNKYHRAQTEVVQSFQCKAKERKKGMKVMTECRRQNRVATYEK